MPSPAAETLDLELVRIVPLSRAAIWRGWTDPQTLMKWFCPRPWRVVDCELDLKPGGIFRTLMRGPDGEEHGSAGCYLELVPERRLVWTSALGPEYRPVSDPFLTFTGVLTLTDVAGGTEYRARVLHRDAEDCAKHAAMGFEAGWGAALDQLVALKSEL